MKNNASFLRTVCSLAIPVALQSMLQSSFSIVDQIMIGQLGSVSIAGVGLAGKFSSMYSVIISAVGAVAGILISQYLGQENQREVKRSFYVNLWLGLGIAALFSVLCMVFPRQIMGLYTTDPATRQAAAEYLSIIAGTFVPMAGATLLSTLFRCIEKARLPLYASLVSAGLNTVINYVLIFGKCGFAPMGARGAAIATLISQAANTVLMLLLLPRSTLSMVQKPKINDRFQWKQYLSMLLPVLACEALWSLGENVYAAIYGHMSTDSTAAMTLTNPVQGLVIGALCGLSQAAGVIVGKRLGHHQFDEAYSAAKKLLLYGFIGSLFLSLAVVFTSSAYVQIYQVEDSVKTLTCQILWVYALMAPVKVLNMILGGGVIRSGGKAHYVMLVDTIGTWCFGVPMGLLSAFVFQLPIPYVYLMLSLEECVRFVISVFIFHGRKWMNQLKTAQR